MYEERRRVWTERLERPAPNQLVLLAAEGERLVGFACAYGADDPTWGTLLDNLHVRREHQSQGVGERLVAEVTAWCRASYPHCGLHLWVLEQNVRARRFYRRLGASDCGGELSVPAGGGQIHSSRYAWSVLPALPRTE